MLELRLDAEPLEGRTHDMLVSESCRSSPDGDLKITQNRDPKELIFRGVCAKSLQLYLTLCDPMDQWTVALQASLSMGILQARILEWVAMPSSRGSSRPRDPTFVSYISCIGRQVLYH